jgi:hypothetical protein
MFGTGITFDFADPAPDTLYGFTQAPHCWLGRNVGGRTEQTGKTQSTHRSHKHAPVVGDATVYDRTVLESQFVQVDNPLAAQLAEVVLLGDNCLHILKVGPQGAAGQPNVTRNASLVL